MSDVNLFHLVQEYCRLAKIMNPSDAVFYRMMAILELAQFDAELSCLISEADHLIAHELGIKE